MRVVVLIDDRPDVRYVMTKRLSRIGFDVHTAESGTAGMELVRKHRPEIVLVDIVLPDMEGYEVARRIRQELGPTVRIAAMTGFAQLEAAKSLDAGFDQHFSSPIGPAALESWLGASRPEPGKKRLRRT